MKNILEFLENNARRIPQSVAFADTATKITYLELLEKTKAIGSALLKFKNKNMPVAVLTNRGVGTLKAMFGVVYSGNFYVVLDADSPNERLDKIIGTLRPFALICDNENLEKSRGLDFHGETLLLEEAEKCLVCEGELNEVRRRAIDTDPLYALFTSGSTGMPKGAVINHKNVISYTEWFTEEYGITEETVFGSQTPFYFSMSVSDVFATLKSGASLHIIPKQFFSFPMKLVEFLNERKVNTIYWVPSALSIIANWKVLDYGKPEHLEKILFAGEVMPVKQLNYWRSHYKNALFSNLFGPTETTDICTFYTLNREFPDDASLPIGNACSNCDVFVVKNDDELVTEAGEVGELYVRGSFLSAGYYNNPEKTAAAFVQNPCNKNYPETVYKTGDLVKYDEYGELMYVSRKDFQIKHMGYRIELGEIENAAYGVERLSSAAVIYDAEADKIVLVFVGTKLKEDEVRAALEEKLPLYMRPNVIIRTKNMPYNQNGKTDRVWLKNNYKTMIKGG